jgi:hypothetical protein
MSYGMGNYMYRGDPGFFGNVFRAVGHVVGGAALGFLTGGPLGAVKGAIGGTVSGTASNIGHTTLGAGDDPAGDAARLAHLKATERAARARGVLAHPAGLHLLGPGMGRRYRHMRWTNTKALGRAERRIHAAVKHMTKYIKWVHPHKVGHAAPKFHKKRRAA